MHTDVENLRKYAEAMAGLHAEDCPADDTCDCYGKPINDSVNRLCEAQRYRLLSDNVGHHYLVPSEKEDDFNAWVDSFNEEDEGDPDGYEKLGAESLGCSPTCVSFTDPKTD